MIPITGAQYEISAGDYQGTVTELGAGLRALRYRGQPVITEYLADELPPGAAGQLLAPWPNRIDSGLYTVADTQHQLDLSEPTNHNAIHGLTRWAAWAAVRHAPDRVLLRHVLLGRKGYPFCLELETEYAVGVGTGLRVSTTARNTGTRSAPYGTGSHPYLTVGTPLIDECALALPASLWLPADERGIPVGGPEGITGTPLDFRDPRPVGATRLDHALTGLARDAGGRAWARLTGSGRQVALWVSDGYGWLHVFTGDTLAPGHRRRALAVEPMTCPPNAFVTGMDLITLDPGTTVSHAWGILVAAGWPRERHSLTSYRRWPGVGPQMRLTFKGAPWKSTRRCATEWRS
ncbi:MAG: aldose 1-epimerase family protein [Pseudonocardiaceae bacterium]